MDHTMEARRAALVTDLAQRHEIRDPRVLTAMAMVPRHLFVPPALARLAYDDTALSIGCEQTISQPYVVAMMSQALRLEPTSRVLEVGTGSGYQTAVLAQLCACVVTVECVPELAEQAAQRFRELHIPGVVTLTGDGTLGHPPLAPYDGIIITAAGERVPPPLWEQLKVGGRLVAPLGSRGQQELHVLEKHANGRASDDVLFDCRFVPLLGAHGWAR